MLRYSAKRILMLIPMLLAVIFLIFVLLRATPTSPGRILLGPSAPQADIDKLNKRLGYTGNVFEMYYSYLKSLFMGDFGISYITKQPVMQDIITRWPATVILAFLGLGIAILIGLPLGILAAVKHNTFIDKIVTAFSIICMSMPVFWFAVMLMLYIGLRIDWLPTFWDGSFKSYLLPSIALGVPYSGGFMRYTRGAMLDVIRFDYIKTAYAKGATDRRVIFVHAFKNASLVIITITGINLGALLGGSVVIENVYAINGIGRMALRALLSKDVPQIMACTIVLASVFMLMMLLVDFAYAFIDPRIKVRYNLR